VAATLDGKYQRPVEPGQFVGPKPFSLTLSQPHASNALAVADLVIQGDSITPEMDPPR
jgi:hypothetical protein